MVSYFSHDSNARNDEKIISLRATHGAAGYGVYFMILEKLRDEKDYSLSKNYDALAFDLHVKKTLIKSVVENFGLFDFTPDGERFFSVSFAKRMKIKDEKSQKRSLAGRKGMGNRWSKPEEEDNNVITNDDEEDNKTNEEDNKGITIKVNKSKVKKSKENKSKENIDDDDESARAREQNLTYFGEYFSGKANLEPLLMQLHRENPETKTVEDFKDLARLVICEWEQNREKPHPDYTSWAKRLIAQIRIKNRMLKDNTYGTTNPNRQHDADAAQQKRDESYARVMAELLSNPDPGSAEMP